MALKLRKSFLLFQERFSPFRLHSTCRHIGIGILLRLKNVIYDH